MGAKHSDIKINALSNNPPPECCCPYNFCEFIKRDRPPITHPLNPLQNPLPTMSNNLPKGYQIRVGSTLDRALLVKFMNRTYKEVYQERDFSHLAKTVEQYLSVKTPIWWVDFLEEVCVSPVGCLWVGNGVDQVSGHRLGHIFLLYVAPEHRRRGIGSALVTLAENWARERGDKQISLQVFTTNKPAVNLYEQLGYKNQSVLMVKSL